MPVRPRPISPQRAAEIRRNRIVAGTLLAAIVISLSLVVARCATGSSGTTAAPTTTATAPPATTTTTTGPTAPATPPAGVVADPDAVLVLVDRVRSLPDTYTPPDLVTAPIAWAPTHETERRMLRQVASDHAVDLFAAADAAGVPLVGISGYRSYATQKAVHDRSVERNGEDEGDRYTALPGHSEHQTGLALDVTAADGSCATEDCFADTPEAAWLAANAPRFGFIVRYPEGADDLTGYSYEPWHLRYVGVDVAEELQRRHLTFDEWLGTAGDDGAGATTTTSTP